MSQQLGEPVSEASLSTLYLDPENTTPLYRQLEREVRRLILSSTLLEGMRMPATRKLASELGISRLTVKTAYEQLVSEGFLEGRQGAGTFVAKIATNELPPITPTDRRRGANKSRRMPHRLETMGQTKAITRLGGVKAFRPGVPALDRFPRRAWASAYSRAVHASGDENFGYGPPGGLPDLKVAISGYVRGHRGIHCEPEQIVVTAGAQQAFVLLAIALLSPEDEVWCEDPGHIAIRDSMRLLGANVRSIPIDAEGFDLNYAIKNSTTPKLIFVTPSHQHPLGVTMSLKRRMDMQEFAIQHDTWIVEDDYDSEYRYAERALPALYALDHTEQVIYVGSFSKSLFPGLRAGYVICPPHMVSALSAGQTLLSQNVSPLQQIALANFIRDGSLNRHVRKMRQLYEERRNLVIAGLNTHAADRLELEPCHAGMHLIGWLKNTTLCDQQAAEAIWSAGVDCLPLSTYSDHHKLRPGLMFGFACADERDIDKNIRTVRKALR